MVNWVGVFAVAEVGVKDVMDGVPVVVVPAVVPVRVVVVVPAPPPQATSKQDKTVATDI